MNIQCFEDLWAATQQATIDAGKWKWIGHTSGRGVDNCLALDWNRRAAEDAKL